MSRVKIDHVILWTDNCACQYKCRQNFLQIATFVERFPGVRISHRFAQKYDFKGVWDAAGKVIKQYMRQQELTKKSRFANAFDCFLKTRDALKVPKSAKDWVYYESKRDPRILDKRTFVVDRRFFGYATEDKTEFTRLGNEYRHIVYTDRDNVPTMAAVEGTQKLHSVMGSLETRTTGGLKQHKLLVAHMPCACFSCKLYDHSGAECTFKKIRQQRELWVSERKERATAMQGTDHDLLYERVKTVLKLDKVTKKVLVEHLRLRNQAVWGKKDVLASRLLEFVTSQSENQEAVPSQHPLACTFATHQSTELDYIGSDDDESDVDGRRVIFETAERIFEAEERCVVLGM
jgi:hypothetical protein